MEKNRLPFLSLPCKMHFDDLSEEEKGYHCSNCDKVLTDFRDKSNEEVVDTIRASEKQVCGVFHQSQFDFKTSSVHFSASQRRVGLSLLGILGFLGPVMTGCSDDHPKNDLNTGSQEIKQKAFNNLKFPMSVEGTLKDEKTGLPLALADVSIFQNGKVIRTGKTDAQGNFGMILQQSDLIKENFDFIVSKKAYETDTLRAFSLGKASAGQKIRLTIKADTRCVKSNNVKWNGEPIVEGIAEMPLPPPPDIVGISTPQVLEKVPMERIPEEHATAGVPVMRESDLTPREKRRLNRQARKAD